MPTRLAVLLCLILTLFTAGSRSAFAVVVGTFDVSRVGHASLATGVLAGRARVSLLASYPSVSFSVAPTLTSPFLAGVDLLVLNPGTSLTPPTPLSADEQSALLAYVQGGGNALLLADGYFRTTAAAQSMVAPFGMTIVDDGFSDLLAVTKTQPSHPIFAGPHGVQSQINVLGAGVFTNLGPYATTLATLQANNLPIITLIDYGAIAPVSGRVLIYSDSNAFADPSADGFFREHETLFLNSIAYLIPEPSTYALAAFGVAALFAVRRRRCHRQQIVSRAWSDTP